MTWEESTDREREPGAGPKQIHHSESGKRAASRKVGPQNHQVKRKTGGVASEELRGVLIQGRATGEEL